MIQIACQQIKLSGYFLQHNQFANHDLALPFFDNMTKNVPILSVVDTLLYLPYNTKGENKPGRVSDLLLHEAARMCEIDMCIFAYETNRGLVLPTYLYINLRVYIVNQIPIPLPSLED